MDEYRAHVLSAMHETSRDFDRAVLTLAGGTLALSVTFAHEIAPTPLPDSLGVLPPRKNSTNGMRLIQNSTRHTTKPSEMS